MDSHSLPEGPTKKVNFGGGGRVKRKKDRSEVKGGGGRPDVFRSSIFLYSANTTKERGGMGREKKRKGN